MIQQLKKDIERTWASVEASHEKEAAAKSQLAELARAIEATEHLFHDEGRPQQVSQADAKERLCELFPRNAS